MIDYDKVLSDKIKNIKPSGIRKFFDIASTMEGVISLGVGEPDFSTPWVIRKAAIQVLERKQIVYGPNIGLAPLRKTISKHIEKKHNVCYDADTEMIVTVGGSEAIDLAVRGLIDPGDEVLVIEPCFVCYAPLVELAGGIAVPVPTKIENNFKLTVDDFKDKITKRTKLIIMPYPNNPTGAIMTKEDLEPIADFLRNTDIMILSDEDREYERYCQKFEDAMRSEGLEYAGKFELTDNLTGSNPTLQVESQRYESLGMGEKEFVNYADGAFENLPSNGCALQLVSGEVNDTGEAMFNMPLCELELPGYYMSESTGRNDTEIMIETELYRPNQSVPFAQDQYQAFEDADFQRGDAGMYYADGKWYLSANLRLNVNPDVPNAASWYQRAKELIGREYIVMNLKFYLRRPAFSKPDWIASVVYPWTGNGDENVSDAETVIDGIINSKESAYASKSLKGEYLGNIVMYLLY